MDAAYFRTVFIVLILATVVCLVLVNNFYNSSLDTNNKTITGLENEHSVFDTSWNTSFEDENSTTVNVDEDMTIVTAYFDLGKFKKGSNSVFTPNLYHKWAGVFKYIVNPLVVYTDSLKFVNLMKSLRTQLKLRTVIVFTKRGQLWPFRLTGRIKTVFSQKGYPRHHPNTVVPEYSAAQHAKYVVVAEAANRRYFNTSYYAWLDIGYFRDIVNQKTYFRLKPPVDYDESKLAMNLISNLKMDVSYSSIFRSNKVWVGGGMFIGTEKLVQRFEKQYQKAVHFFLSQKLMSTDQQILYGMYSVPGRAAIKPNITLQIYVPNGSVTGNKWFHLGYLCRKLLKPDEIKRYNLKS